jgi:hypothetical protein
MGSGAQALQVRTCVQTSQRRWSSRGRWRPFTWLRCTSTRHLNPGLMATHQLRILGTVAVLNGWRVRRSGVDGRKPKVDVSCAWLATQSRSAWSCCQQAAPGCCERAGTTPPGRRVAHWHGPAQILVPSSCCTRQLPRVGDMVRSSGVWRFTPITHTFAVSFPPHNACFTAHLVLLHCTPCLALLGTSNVSTLLALGVCYTSFFPV